MSVLGLDSGYTVKYNPLPSGVPSGTPSGKGLYLTIYPSSRPNTDTIDLKLDVRMGKLLTKSFLCTFLQITFTFFLLTYKQFDHWICLNQALPLLSHLCWQKIKYPPGPQWAVGPKLLTNHHSQHTSIN